MTKTSKAIDQLPPSATAALEKLGADLAVARLRRHESLRSWAGRMGVSVPTLARMESGDPATSMGVYLSALWLVGLDGSLAELAKPDADMSAHNRDVRKAVELGRKRAQSSRNARLAKLEKAEARPHDDVKD